MYLSTYPDQGLVARLGMELESLLKTEEFTVQKLDITVPHNLEVIWSLVRPKRPPQGLELREIICVSFYSTQIKEKFEDD